MLELCTLASGSSGNCLLVTDATTHLLIDAGISARRIRTALQEQGIPPQELSGVLVTHEHSDHISGLSVLLRQLGVPVYASEGTARQLFERRIAEAGLLCPFTAGDSFSVGTMEISSFPTSHDAAESVGYTVASGGRRAAVVTDLGIVTPQVLQGVLGSHLVVAETNHDEEWLRSGPYPYYLKRRILGDRGHLSNEAGGELVLRCAEAGARQFILAHLSAENNTPRRSYDTVRSILERAGADLEREITLEVAPRSEAGTRHTVGKG